MRRLFALLFDPVGFFKSNEQSILRAKGTTVVFALLFAVMVQCFATAVHISWAVYFNLAVIDRWNDLFRVAADVLGFQKPMISFAFEPSWGLFILILAPLIALVKIFLASAVVHLALRFFVIEVEGSPQRFLSTMLIVCCSQTPWIFSIIPVAGSVLAFFLVFGIAICGIAQVYKTSHMKAALVVGFPYLMVFAGMGVLLFAAMFLVVHVLHLVSW